MINRQPPEPNNPPPDLLGQIAAETGLTLGQLLGRPEGLAQPETDLLAEAKQRLPEAGPELMSDRVADAIEEAPFQDWAKTARYDNPMGPMAYQKIVDYASEIKAQLGPGLLPTDLQAWWKGELKPWFDQLESSSDSKKLLAVAKFLGPLFTALLGECIRDGDHIVIDMPDGREIFDRVGWRLTRGSLEVNGNVPVGFGENAGGTARLVLYGDSGRYAGQYAHDDASIIINGNARDYAGAEARDNAKVVITGNVGDHYGYHMAGNARLEIGSIRNPVLAFPGVVDRNFNGHVIVGGQEIILQRN